MRLVILYPPGKYGAGIAELLGFKFLHKKGPGFNQLASVLQVLALVALWIIIRLVFLRRNMK